MNLKELYKRTSDTTLISVGLIIATLGITWAYELGNRVLPVQTPEKPAILQQYDHLRRNLDKLIRIEDVTQGTIEERSRLIIQERELEMNHPIAELRTEYLSQQKDEQIQVHLKHNIPALGVLLLGGAVAFSGMAKGDDGTKYSSTIQKTTT